MAIKRKSLEFIHSVLDTQSESKSELLDLGNSYIRGDGIDYIKDNFEMSGFTYTDNGYGSGKVNIISKQYFTALGYTHTSIDLNGREDSLVIDLRYPITDSEYDLLNKFDFTLDIGTVEHIDNQYMAFKNIHDMCKVDDIDIFCSIRKTKSDDFMSDSDFEKLPLIVEDGKFNDRDLYPYAYK